ncbi:MAG: ankyrin repeat domain-containing protein [Pirellulales bacterium]
MTRIACLFDEEEQVDDEPSQKSVGSKATKRDLLRTLQKHHTPQTIAEIKRLIPLAGELSQIEDRNWPFINLSDVGVLKLLLEAGLRPEIIDTEGHSLLWQCASSPDCVKLLGEYGVDPNRRTGPDGDTALMRAIFLKATDGIKQLLKIGANPTLRLDKRDAKDLKRDAKLFKILEKAKADWQKRKAKVTSAIARPEGKTQVSSAKGPKPSLKKLLQLLKHDRILENEFIEGLPEMIDALGDISGIQDGQWPAIYKFEDPQLLSKLLSAGLNPNIIDKKGHPILYQCAPHPDCISLLLKAGADPNSLDRDGESPLMRAAYVGEIDCVQALLDGGADPTIEFTPSARIMMEFDDEMTEFVEKARKKFISRKQKRAARKR